VLVWAWLSRFLLFSHFGQWEGGQGGWVGEGHFGQWEGEGFLENQEYNINLWQKSKPRIRKPMNYVILLLFLLISISILNFKLVLIFFLNLFISLLMFRGLFKKPIFRWVWHNNKSISMKLFFSFFFFQSCSNILLSPLHLDHCFTIYIQTWAVSLTSSGLTNSWVRFQCTRYDPFVTLHFSQNFNQIRDIWHLKNPIVLNNSCKPHTMINDTCYKSS
jgi:hypothetical protein